MKQTLESSISPARMTKNVTLRKLLDDRRKTPAAKDGGRTRIPGLLVFPVEVEWGVDGGGPTAGTLRK